MRPRGRGHPAFNGSRRIGTGASDRNVTALTPNSFTIESSAAQSGVIEALTNTADAIAKDDYPYVWGGGHALAGIASVGIRGPGYNGRRIGFDCSGSVAAVLAGAGLWPTDRASPTTPA